MNKEQKTREKSDPKAVYLPALCSLLFAPWSVNIQIAAFLERNLANAPVEECRPMGFEPRVEEVEITDRTWYRVVLGPYREIPAAERDNQLIAERTKFQPMFVHHSTGNQEAPSR